MPKFHPKITRCQGCSKLESDCSDLPFHSMPVHRTDGLDTVVICTQFQQMNHGASLRQRNYSRKERHDYPHKHPRRYAAFVEQQMASRGRALGQAMTLRQAARRLGITPLRAEQLAARHGFTFHQGKESNQ